MDGSSPPPPPQNYEAVEEGNEKIMDELEDLKKENAYLRSRIRYLESGRSKCKTSKWSKVKGAFGWEKEKETSLTLKVPERGQSDQSSSFSISPAGSYMSHSSLTTPPPPLSSSSSEEDIHLQGRRRTLTGECKLQNNIEDNRRSKSLDGEPVISIEDPMPKISTSKIMMSKGNKTPWSKVKGMINTKSVRKCAKQEERWNQGQIMNDGGDQEDHSLEEEPCGPMSLTTPKLTVTQPSNEELTLDLSAKEHGRLDSPNKVDQNVELYQGFSRKSKWFKVRNVFLQGSRSAPTSPVRSASFTYDMEGDDMSSGDILDDKDEVYQDEEQLKYEIEASYIELQNKLEEEMSTKYCREVNLSPDFKKKLMEWDKMKLQGGNLPQKDWEHEKERKRKDNKSKGSEKDRESLEEDKSNRIHSREGSFKKYKTGQGSRQEVLIPTSTGTFRFEGISDNFTKKLYEWEQAQGIAPEESTLALLEPEYQPSYGNINGSNGGNGGLGRSKSIGSIADLNTGNLGHVLVQQPSSLSLNDVEDLNHCNPLTTGMGQVDQGAEKSKMIPRKPLFCSSFTSEDNARLVDSRSSNEDRNSYDQLIRSGVANARYQLLRDNINLLDKLRNERDVCRQLENDMRTLEEQINSVSKSFADQTAISLALNRERLQSMLAPAVEIKPYERHVCNTKLHSPDSADEMVSDSRMYEFEVGSHFGNDHRTMVEDDTRCHHLNFPRDYTVKLQDFSQVQTTLFDDEVTHSNHTNYEDNDETEYPHCNEFHSPHHEGPHEGLFQREVIQKILNEMDELAERLRSRAESDTDVFPLENQPLYLDSGIPCSCGVYGQHFSSYTNYWLRGKQSPGLNSIATFLSEKILELKQALNLAKTPSLLKIQCSGSIQLSVQLVSTCEEFVSPPPMSRVLHRTMAHDDLSPGENNPGEYRPPSGTSSSASSFSYHGSSNRLHQDWSQPFSYQHNMGCSSDQTVPNFAAKRVYSTFYLDDPAEGVSTESALRINAPNVFVPTMRKIFSPFSESEAVGVIIAEEDEPSETDYQNGKQYEETKEEAVENCEQNDAREKSSEHGNVSENETTDDSDEQEIEIVRGNELIPSVRLRAKSSSPAVERKSTKFSSVCFFFPVSENGVVTIDPNPPEVEELKLGEELTSSLKMRSLRIKRAREEFLLGEDERHGSLSVVVNEDILLQQQPTSLMVKSASEEMVSVEPFHKTLSSKITEEHHKSDNPAEPIDTDNQTNTDHSAVATLAWSSASLLSQEPSSSHSCPSTPVLEKKTETSWIKNPARMLFRPKGKYLINDRH